MKANKMNNEANDLVFNQQNDLINDVSISNAQKNYQTNKKVKKSHGNRKLQRYRRKLRNQGMDSDTIAQLTSSSVDTTQSKNDEIIQERNEKTTTATVNDETMFYVCSVNKKKKKENKKKNLNTKQIMIKKKKNSSNESISMRKVKIQPLIKDSSDYANVPDEIFCQMSSAVFDGTLNFVCFSNEDEKIKFIRHYTSLIDRLSYLQLQEFQWKYYYHIGMTQNIWKGHIAKHLAEKYSICHTYGRSKTLIQQRLNQIEQHLQTTHRAIQQFEAELLSKFELKNDYFVKVKELNAIIYQFVQEKQRSLQHDFQYKRQILDLDATDHQLLQKFFDVKPNKSQIISARRIWEATKKQMQIEEDIAVLEHRLTSEQSYSPSNLVDHMLDDIDTIVQKLNPVVQTHAKDCDLENDINKLKLLKNDIIYQAIISSRRMADSLNGIIQIEQNKFSVKNRFTESTGEWQQMVLNIIETRRLHMIKRTNVIIKHKLAPLVD